MTLSDFFAAHPKAALAYSGGTDSAYLLYAALKAGADIRPYYICSQFQPDFERQDALRLGAELGAEPVVIELGCVIMSGHCRESAGTLLPLQKADNGRH